MNAIAPIEDVLSALDTRRIAELKPLRNGSLLAQLVAGYTEQGEREVVAIRAACEARRFEEGTILAHSLKSSSLNIGAQLVGIICRQIESELLAGDADRLAPLCDELDAAFRDTLNELGTLLSR
jgi:HPt (histidine-containing phosphotransfer) domain-containing protein